MAAEQIHATRAALAAALLALGACNGTTGDAGSDAGSTADAAVTDAVNDLVPSAPPPGLTPPTNEPMFGLNTSERVITLAIEGDAQHRLEGVLTDPDGRRELRYVSTDGRFEVLAPAGWNLPPAAAVVRGGDTLTCFNALTGRPSFNTRGAMPDPTLGMELRCRLRSAGRWGSVMTVRTPTAGNWVQRVVGRDDGAFRVLFYGDDGWMLAPATSRHGVYDVTYAGGAWSAVNFVMPAPTE